MAEIRMTVIVAPNTRVYSEFAVGRVIKSFAKRNRIKAEEDISSWKDRGYGKEVDFLLDGGVKDIHIFLEDLSDWVRRQ